MSFTDEGTGSSQQQPVILNGGGRNNFQQRGNSSNMFLSPLAVEVPAIVVLKELNGRVTSGNSNNTTTTTSTSSVSPSSCWAHGTLFRVSIAAAAEAAVSSGSPHADSQLNEKVSSSTLSNTTLRHAIQASVQYNTSHHQQHQPGCSNHLDALQFAVKCQYSGKLHENPAINEVVVKVPADRIRYSLLRAGRCRLASSVMTFVMEKRDRYLEVTRAKFAAAIRKTLDHQPDSPHNVALAEFLDKSIFPTNGSTPTMSAHESVMVPMPSTPTNSSKRTQNPFDEASTKCQFIFGDICETWLPIHTAAGKENNVLYAWHVCCLISGGELPPSSSSLSSSSNTTTSPPSSSSSSGLDTNQVTLCLIDEESGMVTVKTMDRHLVRSVSLVPSFKEWFRLGEDNKMVNLQIKIPKSSPLIAGLTDYGSLESLLFHSINGVALTMTQDDKKNGLVSVLTAESETQETLALITAKCKQAEEAEEFIERRQRRLRLLEERRARTDERSEFVEFLVDESLLGATIGKQGDNLCNVSRSRRVEIRLLPDEKGVRRLRIYGKDLERLRKARAAIEYIFYELPLPALELCVTGYADWISHVLPRQVADAKRRAGLGSPFHMLPQHQQQIPITGNVVMDGLPHFVEELGSECNLHSIWYDEASNSLLLCGLLKNVKNFIAILCARLYARQVAFAHCKLPSPPSAQVINNMREQQQQQLLHHHEHQQDTRRFHHPQGLRKH